MLEDFNTGNGFNPFNMEWGEIVEFPSTRKLSEYGNRIYNRYPARSIFLVPRTILSSYKGKGLKILDPFMGSGTTAVETVLSGNKPFGVEMDPFARLVSEVSSTVYTETQLDEMKDTSERVLSDFKKKEPAETPDLLGISHWFGDGVLNSLLKLKQAILDYSKPEYLPFMLVAFADCIKPASLMERQSLKPYISTKYTKIAKPPEESFRHSFEMHSKAALEMSKAAPNKAYPLEWVGNDATTFEVEEQSFDMAITSPPYINALDYTRCIKIESSLVGTTDNEGVAALRKLQVGYEKRRKQDIDERVVELFAPYHTQVSRVNKTVADTSLAYFNDILKNLTQVGKALKTGSMYHIVVGDNTVRGVHIPTHEIIARLAEVVGYKWVGYYQYAIKDHRNSIPRSKPTDKIATEHVLMLQR